eukprot:5326007-Amphidinium_carterae.3
MSGSGARMFTCKKGKCSGNTHNSLIMIAGNGFRCSPLGSQMPPLRKNSGYFPPELQSMGLETRQDLDVSFGVPTRLQHVK